MHIVIRILILTNLICYITFVLDHNDTEINGVEEGYYPNGSPYRIQRHAANIRERKRMLRWEIILNENSNFIVLKL